MLDKSVILATSAIHIITVVPVSLLGLTYSKVTLNSIIHLFLSLQAEGMKKYEEEQLPNFLRLFERLLSQNHDGNGFFVGDSVRHIF